MNKELGGLQEAMMNNPFPGSHISPSYKETQECGLLVAKAVFANHVYHSSLQDRVNSIETNRAYATNNQNPDQYKSMLDASYSAGQKDKTLYKENESLINVDYRVWSPAKKFVNTIVGTFIDSRFSLQYNSIDKNSKSEKEMKRKKLLANILLKEQMQIIAGIIGEDSSVTEEEKQIKAPEDIDLYMSTNYKQGKEIAMELLAKHVLASNKYYENIEPRLIHDLVENNKACVKPYFDSNKNIAIRYADIVGYVSDHSDYPTNEYVNYEGEMRSVSFLELRSMLSENYEEDIDKLMYELAEKAANAYGYPWRASYQYRPNQNHYFWNDYRIDVLDFAWYTTDTESYRHKNKDGKFYVDRKKATGNSGSSEYISKDIQVTYEGLYVPTVDRVFNWKKQEDMTRPMTSKGLGSSVVKKYRYVEPNKRNGSSSSVIDDIRSCLDSIQLSKLKICQLMVESGPPGIAVDWDGLTEMLVEGAAISQKELINIYRTKGILFYSGKTEEGTQQRIPIHEIKSDFSRPFETHITNIHTQIGLIRDATGVNDAIDGSARSQDALVGVQKQKMIASSKLLRELFNAYSLQLFQPLGDTLRDMIQKQIRYGWREKEYREVIGDAAYELLKIEAEKPFPLFGCHVNAVLNEDQLTQIEGQLSIGLETQSISHADVIDIMSMGNTKQILQTLKLRERRNNENRAAEMQAAAALESQKIQAASEARVAAETAIAKAKADNEIRVIEAKKKAEIDVITQKITLEGAGKLREIDRTADRDDQQIELAAEVSAKYGNDNSKVVGSGSRPAPPVKITPPAKNTLQEPENKS